MVQMEENLKGELGVKVRGEIMKKTKSELLQTLIFLVILFGNLFLATRYWSREDVLGASLFAIVMILSAVAAFGHFLEWRKAK